MNPNGELVSHDHNFQLAGDYNIITKLLRSDPLYNIPSHLRDKIINHCQNTLDADADSATVSEKTAASKVVLECDKRNIDIVKMAMPKHVVHHNVEDYSDDELKAQLQKLIDQGALEPRIGRLEIIDAQ